MTTHPHADFCAPRPGEDEQRMESYRVTRTDDRGMPTGSVAVRRCMECGEATYDGQIRRDPAPATTTPSPFLA